MRCIKIPMCDTIICEQRIIATAVTRKKKMAVDATRNVAEGKFGKMKDFYIAVFIIVASPSFAFDYQCTPIISRSNGKLRDDSRITNKRSVKLNVLERAILNIGRD